MEPMYTHPHTHTQTLTCSHWEAYLITLLSASKLPRSTWGWTSKESDAGIRWIPMVLLELDLLSQFSRGEALCYLMLPWFGFYQRMRCAMHAFTYNFTVSDSWEERGKDYEKWGQRIRGSRWGGLSSGDGVRWGNMNMWEFMLAIVMEGTRARVSPHSCFDLCSRHVRSD